MHTLSHNSSLAYMLLDIDVLCDMGCSIMKAIQITQLMKCDEI